MCTGRQPSARGSVDRSFPLSATACVLDLDTDASRPGKRCNSCRATPTRKTPTDMDIEHQRADNAPPRPSVCPICGMTADNGIPRQGQGAATAYYRDAADHLWSVTWLEVA